MIDIESGLKRPKIDMHTHVWRMDDPDDVLRSADSLVEASETLGITESWASAPFANLKFPTTDDVRAENDAVIAAVKRHPDHIRGMCYVLPSHFGFAQDEIDRCLDNGCIGIKLYFHYTLSDPVTFPVIEHAIERRIPILMHAGYLTDPKDLAGQPNVSHGEHFTRASQEYPEAVLIHAHVGGGGEWERTVRTMRDASPNVYADVSGSNLDDGQVEFAVREMGASRVLFGTDGTMCGAVGKVLDADITEQEREMIFWSNAERILDWGGRKPTVLRGEVVR